MKTDLSLKQFLSENKNFACFFNTHLFDSKQIIKPDELSDVDSSVFHKHRDIIKLWKHKGKRVYLGIENQSQVHLYMPLRIMSYETLQYETQIKLLKHQHNEQKDLSTEEYLSGISMQDKLDNCITLTFYTGEDEWKAPRKMKELFDKIEFEEAYHEYEIRLIELKETSANMYYEESMQTVFEISALIYKDDEKTLREKYDKKIDQHLAEIIFSIVDKKTKLKEIMPVESEGVNMCQALDRRDARARAEGRTQGIAEGKAEGSLNTLLAIAKEMLERGFNEEVILSFHRITKQILAQAKNSL